MTTISELVAFNKALRLKISEMKDLALIERLKSEQLINSATTPNSEHSAKCAKARDERIRATARREALRRVCSELGEEVDSLKEYLGKLERLKAGGI